MNYNYREYLKSAVWQALRAKALENARYRCQLCNSEHPLNVHHRKYPKRLGSEPLADLVVLCRKCHKAFHDKLTVGRERNWQNIVRYVLFADGRIEIMTMTKPQFRMLKERTPDIVDVMGAARYARFTRKDLPHAERR